MQLNLTTDYAIRIIFYMAQSKRLVTSKEVSENMKIPHSISLRLLNQFKKAGFINNQLGVKGGFSLKREATEITLLDIIQETESTIKINRCLEHDEFCSRFSTKNCPVRSSYLIIQNTIEEQLGKVTIDSLINKT